MSIQRQRSSSRLAGGLRGGAQQAAIQQVMDRKFSQGTNFEETESDDVMLLRGVAVVACVARQTRGRSPRGLPMR